MRDDPPHDTRYGEITGVTWSSCNAGERRRRARVDADLVGQLQAASS